MKFSWCRGMLFAVSVLLAAGCQPVAERHLQRYLQALDALTGADTAVIASGELLTYPSHRQRHLPLPALRVGFGEFFDLYGCRLFFLVNQRNSIMGRVMPISQRLAYEIRFLRAARQCQERLRRDDRTTVIQRLEEIIHSKREMLPALLWNATFDSPEMAKAFSLAVSPLAPDEAAGFEASREALDYFLALGERLEDPAFEVDTGVLESHYQILQAHHYGGRLATTLALLADHLAAANTTLERAGAHCADHRRSSAEWNALLEALTPVKQLAATVERQGGAWLDRVHRLIVLTGVQPPPAFQRYRAAMLRRDAGPWQRFQRTLHRHRALQHRWLEHCAPPGLRQRLRF